MTVGTGATSLSECLCPANKIEEGSECVDCPMLEKRALGESECSVDGAALGAILGSIGGFLVLCAIFLFFFRRVRALEAERRQMQREVSLIRSVPWP